MNRPAPPATARVSVRGLAIHHVREATLLLCGATAEALHATIAARPEGSWTDLEEVREYLGRLNELSLVLGQLDVPARSNQATELNASVDVLHDAISGALLDVGERIASACDASRRGTPSETLASLAYEVVRLDVAVQRIAESR